MSKDESAPETNTMAGIATTTAKLTLAIRAKHVSEGKDTAEGLASHNERLGVTITASESARLFAGGDTAHPASNEVALKVMHELNAMSLEEWWAHEFILHPTCWVSVHDRL